MSASWPVGRDAAPQTAQLSVRHITELYYGAGAEEAHSELRMTPVDTGLQTVLSTQLEVEPQTMLRKHRDYFGNVVHHFDVLEPHAALCITAESVVETAHAVACGPESAADPRPWRERWSEFLHASAFVPELPHYAAIEHGVESDLPGDCFLTALEELGAILKRDFRYEPGLTEVDSSPEVFFEKGGGVCQDFSHAALGILRQAGVPARYASGYLYDPAADPKHPEKSELLGAAASHAWVQAWHEGLGWVGLDPTNDKLVDWQYVRAAIGRDYGDVRPLRGTFRGEGGQALSVTVEVARVDGSG